MGGSVGGSLGAAGTSIQRQAEKKQQQMARDLERERNKNVQEQRVLEQKLQMGAREAEKQQTIGAGKLQETALAAGQAVAPLAEGLLGSSDLTKVTPGIMNTPSGTPSGDSSSYMNYSTGSRTRGRAGKGGQKAGKLEAAQTKMKLGKKALYVKKGK